MYGIITNVCPKTHPNVGKYTIHGATALLETGSHTKFRGKHQEFPPTRAIFWWRFEMGHSENGKTPCKPKLHHSENGPLIVDFYTLQMDTNGDFPLFCLPKGIHLEVMMEIPNAPWCWNIYQHSPTHSPKCRLTFHTWSIWGLCIYIYIFRYIIYTDTPQFFF